jgi:eukaryotic-like serine/threonine-protein kinase
LFDVWGIDAVLVEATTGELPCEAYDDETRYEQLERRAKPIRSHRRVPAAVATTVEACLEPDPALRPTVAELTKRLMDLT